MVSTSVLLVCASVAAIMLICGSAEAATDCAPCPNIPKHYEELGCKGHTADGGCCPERFDCPDLKNYAEDKCMFRGRAYNVGEKVADNIEADCNAECRCSNRSGKPRFECAQIECPELFQGEQEGCVSQRSLTTCCAPNSVCGDEAKQLPQCHHEGKQYLQGDKIYPTDAQCHVCICDGNWDNSTRIAENKNCRRLDCGIELRSLHRIRGGCVPVYFGEKSCCPIDYRCPHMLDAVVPLETRSAVATDPKMVCTYDQLTLQVGQKLNSEDKCIECTCRNPPMVHCVRKPDCN